MSLRLLAALLIFLSGVSAFAQEPFAKTGVAFLQKYCTDCHGATKQKADLSLHIYRDDVSVLKQRKVWKHVIDAVQDEEMPPDDKPQPTKAERNAFVATAKTIFSNYDLKAKPDPGRVTIRRLNRSEYNNTVSDLLGVDVQPANNFPTDGVGYGFDNIGDVLSISPLLMEQYLDAAQMVAEQAIPLEAAAAVSKKRMAARFCEPAGPSVVLRGEWRDFSPGKDAIGTGPMNTPFKAEPNGTYTVSASVWADAKPGQKVRVALLAAGENIAKPEPLARFSQLEADKVPQVAKCRVLQVVEVTARSEDKPQVVEGKMIAIAGVERVALALVRDPANANVKLAVKWLEIAGPEDARSPFLKKWAQAAPGKPPGIQTRTMLAYFMPRAWHRVVAPDEIERVARLADAAMKRGETWEAGMRQCLVAVLSSPKFLFRMEIDDQPYNADPHPINEFQLATRLSYFLWSTCPDDELLSYALSNKLTANLDAQIKRMLKDPRAEMLVDNFAMQWLQLRRLAAHEADTKAFDKWRPNLQASMMKETRLFFAEIIREDRSVLDLLDADFTYLDRRLGEIYNVWPDGGYKGDDFRRVSLTGTNRGGLLTQASILTVTSNPTRTSPVKRGKWILEQLLGDPPPAPPPVVPSLDDESRKELSGTFRQRLEQHRADPKCANCHAKMDTMGFAMENFNGIGQWRDKNELGQPVEVGGKLANGKELKSLADLKKMLTDEKEAFTRCLTEKMLIYAIGRGLEYYDDRAVEKIRTETAKGGYKFSALVTAIAKSDPFRLRRGNSQKDD